LKRGRSGSLGSWEVDADRFVLAALLDLAEVRVILEDEAEHGREDEQQREDREEAVVGDRRRVVAPWSSVYFCSTASGKPIER
jgi:hypothetical protein